MNSTARQKTSEKSSQNSSSGESSSGGGSSSGNSSSSNSSQTTNQEDSKQISENQKDVITNPDDLTAGTSSIIGNRGTENFGIAVFKEDKLCGELTAVESICHLLINNKVDSCIISIENPISEKENEKMELQIFPERNTKINVNLENDTPNISIDLKLDADIMTLHKDINYEIEEVISKISEATKNYLTNLFNNYLNKVIKEYNVDIDNFSEKAPAHFSTISEWKDFNWDEKFKNSNYNVKIDINIFSTMLVTKT